MINTSELKEKFIHGDKTFPMNYYEGKYYDVYLHWHEEMEIIYIKNGQATFNIDFNSFNVKKGDILIIPPTSLHSAHIKDSKSIELQTIVFNLNFLMSYIPDQIQIKYINPIKNNELRLPILVTENDFYYLKALSIILKIIDELKNKEYGYEINIKAQFYQLFYLLLKDSNQTNKTNDSKINKNIDKIKTILNYIDSNIENQITIEDISNLIGYTPNYFCAFFKKQTGYTFFEYLNYYKIEKAKYLLLNTNESITEITYQTGFQDLSYFIRIFKHINKVSPSKYRDSIGNRV